MTARLVDPYAAGLAGYLSDEYDRVVAESAAREPPPSVDAGVPANMRRCWIESSDKRGRGFGPATDGQIKCHPSRGMPACLVVRNHPADEALAASYEALVPLDRELLSLWALSEHKAHRDRAGWVAARMKLPPERAATWSADAVRRRLAKINARLAGASGG